MNKDNIHNLVQSIEDCWNNGIMKYWDNQTKLTYSEFMDNVNINEREILKKKWENANSVIEIGDEKLDDSRSDYFDPFPIDRYTFDELPSNEQFNWIIKDNNIWVNLFDKNSKCLREVSIIYANLDKKLHVILSNFNNILFTRYKHKIIDSPDYENINNEYLAVKEKLVKYIGKNFAKLLNYDYSGKGIMKEQQKMYLVYLTSDNEMEKNLENKYSDGISEFKKIIKMNKIKNCKIYKQKKTSKSKKRLKRYNNISIKSFNNKIIK